MNDEVLDNVHEDFLNLAYTSNFKVHSFQEARGFSPIMGFGKKVSGRYLTAECFCLPEEILQDCR